LKGYEAETWDKSNEEDLVSMTHRYQDKDVLSKWIDIHVIPFYHRTLGHRLKVGNASGIKHTTPSSRPVEGCFMVLLVFNLAIIYRTRKSSVKVTPPM
jgi:hypothetical protein